MYFQDIKIKHISREFNSKADDLSKEALNLEAGELEFQHFVQGRLIQEETVVVF